MLALSRYVGESIWLRVGDVRIQVKLMGTSRWAGKQRAKLAFDAPPCVEILREELIQEAPCKNLSTE